MIGVLRNLWYLPRRVAVIDCRTLVAQHELRAILQRLSKAENCQRPPRYRLVPIVGPVTRTVGPVAKTPLAFSPCLSGELLVSLSITSIDQFTCAVAPKNAKGQPAPVEAPNWLTDNTDVVALDVSPDGLSCTVRATGVPGTANVQFEADADMGSGVTLIRGTLEVIVTPAQAVTVDLVPGPVSVQP